MKEEIEELEGEGEGGTSVAQGRCEGGGTGEYSVMKEEIEVLEGERGGGTSVVQGRCEGGGAGTGIYTWLSRSLAMTKQGGSGRI